jgi:hypothetical protein
VNPAPARRGGLPPGSAAGARGAVGVVGNGEAVPRAPA